MRLAEGVNPFGLRPELLLALVIADSVWQKYSPEEFVVTSLNDSIHMEKSLHYDGKAGDHRIWGLSAEELIAFRQELWEFLGSNPDYDIVVEADHIHIEYQPKLRTAQ